MSEDRLDVLLRLQGAQAFRAEAEVAARSVAGVGNATEAAGRKAEVAHRRLGIFGGGFNFLRRSSDNAHGALSRVSDTAEKGAGKLHLLAGGAAAVGGAFIGFHAAETAVHATETLGHAALLLHRAFGLNEADAVRWAAQANVRGIATKALGMSFNTLSRQTQSAVGGSKSATETFRSMGISTRELHGHANNLSWILSRVSDGLHRLPAGTQRAATAQRLFGRGWQALLPLLSEGSKKMREQLLLADKYGVTFHGHTVKSLHELIQAQRESKMATLGLQVAFGTQLAPVLTKIITLFTHAWQWLYKNRAVVVPLVGTILVLAATIKVLTAVTAAWNLIMEANPIVLIITGLVLLAAGFVLAYHKVKWFRDVVNEVWSWIKGHWPLLLGIMTGGIGPAVPFIVRHWAQIKQAATDVWHWVTHAWGNLTHGISTAVSWVVGFVKAHWPLILAILTGPIGLATLFIVRHWNTIAQGATDAWSWIKRAFTNAVSFVGSLPGKFGAAATSIYHAFTGVFSGLGSWIGGVFKGAVNIAVDVLNFLIQQLNSVSDFIKSASNVSVAGVSLSGGGVDLGHIGSIPHMAAGGVLTSPGRVMVGERGPELLTLPAHARVDPLAPAGPARVRPLSAPLAARIPDRAAAPGGHLPVLNVQPMQAPAPGPITVHTHVYLDKRKIAEAVGEYTAKQMARA